MVNRSLRDAPDRICFQIRLYGRPEGWRRIGGDGDHQIRDAEHGGTTADLQPESVLLGPGRPQATVPEQASTVFNKTGRASDVKLAIVITDGVPCTPDDPMSGSHTCRSIIPDPVPSKTQSSKAIQWATSMKNNGVTIVTIAVGDFGTNGVAFVNKISSAPSSRYVFNPSTWKDLPQLIQNILDSICPPDF